MGRPPRSHEPNGRDSNQAAGDPDAPEIKPAERAIIDRIGRIAGASIDSNEVYRAISTAIGELIPYDRFSVAHVDPRTNRITVRFATGTAVPEMSGGSLPIPSGLIQEDKSQPKVLIFNLESREGIENDLLKMVWDWGFRCVLAAPIFSNGVPIAAISLSSKSRDAYGEREMVIMELVSDRIAVHVANAELHADLQRELRIRSALADVARAITGSLDLADVMNSFAQAARPLIPFDRLVLTTYDRNRRMLKDAFVWGRAVPGLEEGREFSLERTVLRQVIEGRTGLLLSQASETEGPTLDGRIASVRAGLYSFLAVPLISSGEVLGTLNFKSAIANAYTTEHLDLATQIAAHIAGAASNAQQHAALRTEAERQVKQLQELDALRVQFLGMVSHELKTPLTSIRVSRDLLAQMSPAETGSIHYLKTINSMANGVERLEQLVTDILDLTTAQLGSLRLDRTWLPVKSLIEQSVQLVAPLFDQKKQTVSVRCPNILPSVHVDRRRVEEVLLNLLNNVNKYSPAAASVTIEALQQGKWVEIRVSGSGNRIPEADLPHIFQPFFRGTSPATRTVEGRGLGLSIAKAFVELHGGSIGVSQGPNESPVFYFTLPTEMPTSS